MVNRPQLMANHNLVSAILCDFVIKLILLSLKSLKFKYQLLNLNPLLITVKYLLLSLNYKLLII